MTEKPDESRQALQFSFTNYRYQPETGEAVLSYHVDGLEFKERITFPWAPWPVDASRQAAFYRALETLHLVAGISYYKAGLARTISADEVEFDEAVLDFLNGLYVQGLGEFAYVNNLDLTGLINFENKTESIILNQVSGRADLSMPLDLPERALVAMGGGKDSLVCLQMLIDSGLEVQPACVGGSVLIGETARAAKLPLIRVQRELSPALGKLNADGAWNGHVPVTAINSAILLCAGLLYGYRYVVFANESSASEPTLIDNLGNEINHQYSKSLAFEKTFRNVISTRISPNVEYFSLLRSFSELAIARRFSELTRYHEIFSSCNRNFHQDGSHIDGRWCQDCPKCRFAALALAPFLTPEQLVTIQGTDLLNNENQISGFKALCGLDGHKPFECVGSIEESRAAMKFLAGHPDWRNRKIVDSLAVREEIIEATKLDTHPDPAAENCIPPGIQARLDAL
jgi:hypothetical protein